MSLDGPIRVLVVDDHPTIALAIRAAIEADAGGDLGFAGAARSVEEARAALASGGLRPAVVLGDVQLRSGLDGLDVIGLASAAGTRSIVLTSFDRASLMRAAFERGASGFLDKSAEPEQILAAIRAVAGGGTAFSATALDAARSAPRMPSGGQVSQVLSTTSGSV